MQCQNQACASTKTRIIKTIHTIDAGKARNRMRVCNKCGCSFFTWEKVDEVLTRQSAAAAERD